MTSITETLQEEAVRAEVRPLKKIALAVDGSDESRQALAFVKDLAVALGAEVTVVHFVEKELPRYGGPLPIETSEESRDLVAKTVAELTAAGLTVGADVEYSRPFGEAKPLARVAERFGAQLIVVGSRGLSTGVAWLTGSVSHDLIHATKVPILIVR